MKLVLVFGTFDVLHPGHLFFLKQAKKKGDTLIASVARDSFVARMKKEPPLHSEQERIARLRASGLVDEALLSDAIPGTYDLILTRHPQLICLGYDQLQLKENLGQWLKEQKLLIPIEIIPSFEPQKYKSSKLKQELFVAIDAKTTGPRPGMDNLVEIGAVLFNREKELDTFHTFIEPLSSTDKSNPGDPGWSGRKEGFPGPLLPLGETLPALVRFCRQAYPVTKDAVFTCGFLLYYLSLFHIDTLRLANLAFDIEQLTRKKTSGVTTGNRNPPGLPGQPENYLIRTALDDARMYQTSFRRYLTDTTDPSQIQSLYTQDFATTADGEALNFNWQIILRQLHLSLLEESLLERKTIPIDYLDNNTFTRLRICPLAIGLERSRIILFARQEGQGDEKRAILQLNRIKLP